LIIQWELDIDWTIYKPPFLDTHGLRHKTTPPCVIKDSASSLLTTCPCSKTLQRNHSSIRLSYATKEVGEQMSRWLGWCWIYSSCSCKQLTRTRHGRAISAICSYRRPQSTTKVHGILNSFPPVAYAATINCKTDGA
jgi:hypothetical protein